MCSNPPTKKLSDVIGTALAKKLEDDSTKAIADYRALLITKFNDGLNTRLELAKDELDQLSEDQRLDALHILYHKYRDDALDALLNVAAAVAFVDRMRMSEYVSLSASIYEDEARANILHSVQEQHQAHHSEAIHAAAARVTGTNN